MGETLLLLSCGVAFITGLVIVAASLFGRGHCSRSFRKDRGRSLPRREVMRKCVC